VLPIDTRKESAMSKKIKVNISLGREIYEKGKAMADELGIPFSTLISILISNEANKNNKKKG
jgi:antitoxin component of RelBE/YafQ-DinJ toxin-antitoxin module